MSNHIFCAPIDAADDADQLLREIVAEIERLARSVFGAGTHTTIFLGRQWVVGIDTAQYETLAQGVAETLVDALHVLKRKIEAKRAEADQLNRTLGIWA